MFAEIYQQVYTSLNYLINACRMLSWSVILTFSDFVDCSLPDSFVHGILQARILEWVAMQIPFMGFS